MVFVINSLKGNRMAYKIENAIIMVAGYSSRFAPISYEMPKSLITVKGEVLLERQIKQLKEMNIEEIVLVVGYKKESFNYLVEKFGVIIIENNDFDVRDNYGSLWAARKYLKNSYVCSGDNYFSENPFETEAEFPYYSVVYSEGETNEWCVSTDDDGWINSVNIGGCNSWYMMGHVFLSEEFSRKLLGYIEKDYNNPDVRHVVWEGIYKKHMGELKLKMKQYKLQDVYEFDSLDELREFDVSYENCSGSEILKSISIKLGCEEFDIKQIVPTVACGNRDVTGFEFICKGDKWSYEYSSGELFLIEKEG